MRTICALLFFLTIITSSSVYGQASREKLLEHYNSGIKAYDAKEYRQFLFHFQKADSISPSHPTITYNLAAAHSLNGKYKESSNYLRKAILMNTNLLPLEDVDFDSLMKFDDYRSIEYLVKELNTEVRQSKVAFTIDEKDLHPESIVYDPISKSFLISSVHKSKIVSYDPISGSYSEWKSTLEDGLWAVMGMKVDTKNSELWVCSTATKEMLNYDSINEGKTAIFRYNLKSKELIKRYELSGGHWFGDLVVDPSGDVLISDSQVPIIYKIDRLKDELTILKDFTGELFNLQGIDLDESGDILFIADYKVGLHRFDLNEKKLTRITTPESVITKGIDGLYYYRGNLIGIHNGVRPMRVCRYKLNGDATSIIDYEYIDKSREELDEPTLGVVVDQDFYYVANSPWGHYDKEGNLLVEELEKNIILKYKLE